MRYARAGVTESFYVQTGANWTKLNLARDCSNSWCADERRKYRAEAHRRCQMVAVDLGVPLSLPGVVEHLRMEPSRRKHFLYQTPESFTCPDQPRKAASDFFNFKVWLVVALAQAVVWGVVASVALRWLFYLWLYTRETAGRLRRKITVAILLRVILFGGSLWF